MDCINFSKQIPVRFEADILVAGSGMAGIAAALAAAMEGMNVILVERFGVLGGNATAGGVANFCGNNVGQGSVLEMVMSALEEFGAIAPRVPGKGRVFDHEILAVILPELLVRQNVKFLLHTSVADAILNDNRIEAAIIYGPSGLEAIRAKQFIDCTGEGVLARCAGFSVMKGGSSKYQLPMSLMYFVRHVPEGDVKYIPEGWFEKITDSDKLPMTSVWPNGPRSNAIKIKVPMYDSTDTESLTNAELNGRRKMMSVLDYHQRQEKRSWILDHCSAVIGIREGVRIEGDYVLTVDDLRNTTRFPDVIAVGTYYLDGHKPDDDKRTYILPPETIKVPPYDIPLRCLIARDGVNLMMAGRCLSADQLALSSARVMTTCSMTGQAAGVTAALAVKQGVDVRQVAVAEVQENLKASGAILDRDEVASFYKKE